MKINLLVQFLALIDELRGQEETTAEFERLLTLYGFDYYGLLQTPKPVESPTSLLLAGRWPKGWPETYLRKRYMQIDPTLRYLGHAQAGFRWRDTLGAFRLSPHRKRMERMMVDARQNGLEDGYVFPVHGRRGLHRQPQPGRQAGRAGKRGDRAFRRHRPPALLETHERRGPGSRPPAFRRSSTWS
jgi:LuxR family transcriptional regulator